MNELMRRLLILSVVLVFHTACAQYVCAQLPPLAVVHVIVTYEDGTPVPDALVEIKNLNTNAVINDSTDENGSCACAIPSSADWKIGDEILISAQDAFGNYAETNLTISSAVLKYPLIEVSLTLVATPPPSPTQSPTPSPTPSPSLSPTPTTSPTESPTTTTTTTPTVPLPTPTEIPTTTETPMSPTTAGTPSAATTPPESPSETPTSPTPTPGFSLIIMSIATITAIYLRRRLNERK